MADMAGKSIGGGFVLRPYFKSDGHWVASAHIKHYRSVERFDASFDDAVWHALSDIDSRLGNDRTFGLILLNAHKARCGSVFACDTGVAARIRLFLLDRGLHGQGLGRAMFSAVLGASGDAGFSRIEVSTFDAHASACRLYSAVGFIEQARMPTTTFGRRMAQVDFAYEFAVL
jgi:GNAT superfamily N-acetyltransferase